MDNQNDNATPGLAAPGDFTLEYDIVVADKVVLSAGTVIHVRKPMGGALRGANIGGLVRMDYNQVALVAPRVTQPILHPHLVDAMDPADITQIAGVLVDFLLPTATKEALSQSM
ncbi:phage tail assembly protein [Sphingomonas faeni]|uniref:phage tail assembly protein n=1 Tax=Sphingomonas faeni TaxID=185950 RepID=UPI0020C7AAD2|nr:phage tail assembly protein [Sphingomonas faeni]MCP8892991.1 phage tail assembly protein [Sphingomonas faeni]